MKRFIILNLRRIGNLGKEDNLKKDKFLEGISLLNIYESPEIILD